MNIRQIVQEARQAGRIAAQKKLAELQKAGPQWNVVDDNTGRNVGQMLDCCGFANIQLKDHRGQFWREFKKLAKENNSRVYCAGAGQYGGWIDIFDMTGRQEVSVNEAACEGALEVLRKYGVEGYVTTRLD